jgi:hypothetical protein
MDPPAASQFKPQYNEPVQVDAVGPSTLYITLTAGGDDLGFGDIGKACIEGIQVVTNDLGGAVGKYYHLTATSCLAQLQKEETGIPALVTHLTALYTDLLVARAPLAELVVLGYPRILPESYAKAPTFNGVKTCVFNIYPILDDDTFYVGMTEQDATAADDFIRKLNDAVQSAVSRVPAADSGRIDYVDSYDHSVPRNCTGFTANATVNGLMLQADHDNMKGFVGGFISPATLHPTVAGQRLFAELVEDAFQKFRRSSPWSPPGIWPVLFTRYSSAADTTSLYEITGLGAAPQVLAAGVESAAVASNGLLYFTKEESGSAPVGRCDLLGLDPRRLVFPWADLGPRVGGNGGLCGIESDGATGLYFEVGAGTVASEQIWDLDIATSTTSSTNGYGYSPSAGPGGHWLVYLEHGYYNAGGSYDVPYGGVFGHGSHALVAVPGRASEADWQSPVISPNGRVFAAIYSHGDSSSIAEASISGNDMLIWPHRSHF